MNKYLFLFLMLSFWSCETTTPTDPGIQIGEEKSEQAAKKTTLDATDRKIILGERIGLITPSSTEADIIKAYGQNQVQRTELGLGEGETTQGTVVFPGTSKELEIIWSEPYQKIQEVRIQREGSPWKTDQGVEVGLTVEALEVINGKALEFFGFEWDYSGLVADWNGGNISSALRVFLEPQNPEAVYPDLLGDAKFSTTHPKVEAAGLKIVSMSITMNQ